MSYQLTKKEKLKEIVKSGKEPKYFINSYTKISHPIKGLIPFKTYEIPNSSQSCQKSKSDHEKPAELDANC